MRYAILVYGVPGAFEQHSQEDQQRVFGEFWGLARGPGVEASGFLPPTETPATVRVNGGDTVVTDGPFAETREVLGGFYVVDVEDAGAALEFAARVPARWVSGAVEVRPL